MARRFLATVFALALMVSNASYVRSDEEGFTPMFNGRDLSGWVIVNVAPKTFTIKDGIVVSTGVPTGVIRTEKQYENFILELEWRHMKPKGNAGVFAWGDSLTAQGTPFAKGIEVQVLDGHETPNYTSHGDVFAIHGARMKPDRPHPNGWERCLPSEKRAKPSPEWNHYRVECRDGVLKLAVNGKVVSGGSECKPRKGYLCLESEGSECHFRNVRIKELPSSNPPADEVAPLAEGFQNLYTGIDLTNWLDDPGHRGHWQPQDWVLNYDGKSEAKGKDAADAGHLWTDKEYGDFVMICDWRLPAKLRKSKRPLIHPNGDEGPEEEEFDDAGDSGIYLRGNDKSQVNIWSRAIGSGEVRGYRVDKSLSATVREAVTPKIRADKPVGQWNRFIITMKGDQLTVVLNGQTVVNHAQLPGVPARGRIALQHHGDPVQFASIFIRELK